jgi:hypothetical protein
VHHAQPLLQMPNSQALCKQVQKALYCGYSKFGGPHHIFLHGADPQFLAASSKQDNNLNIVSLVVHAPRNSCYAFTGGPFRHKRLSYAHSFRLLCKFNAARNIHHIISFALNGRCCNTCSQQIRRSCSRISIPGIEEFIGRM